MRFFIYMIQIPEFVNDSEWTDLESGFEKTAKALHIALCRTRPYSPRQNGKVERSHKEDCKILYNRITERSLQVKKTS